AASQLGDENGLRIESYAVCRAAAESAAGGGSGLEVMRALLKRETLLEWPFLESAYRNGGGLRLQEAIGRKR
ncbi:MAG: hypothetical protein KA134_03630, partial [Achromobacter sp.]|nr:hypothetical protein [Achromobacter sp.]